MASETLRHVTKGTSKRSPDELKRYIVGWGYGVLVVIVSAVIILASFKSVGLFSDAQRPLNSFRVAADMETTEIVVRPGDTLWAIAQSLKPEGRDVREVVDWIRQLNGLNSGTLQIGQVLRVPDKQSYVAPDL